MILMGDRKDEKRTGYWRGLFRSILSGLLGRPAAQSRHNVKRQLDIRIQPRRGRLVYRYPTSESVGTVIRKVDENDQRHSGNIAPANMSDPYNQIVRFECSDGSIDVDAWRLYGLLDVRALAETADTIRPTGSVYDE